MPRMTSNLAAIDRAAHDAPEASEKADQPGHMRENCHMLRQVMTYIQMMLLSNTYKRTKR